MSQETMPFSQPDSIGCGPDILSHLSGEDGRVFVLGESQTDRDEVVGYLGTHHHIQ